MENNFLIHVDDYGRSPKISSDILSLIDKKKIDQVSSMIGFVDKKYHTLLNQKKIGIRLHLNLTDNKSYAFNSNKEDTTFFELIFLRKKNRKFIFNEIENQINQFKRVYNLKSIKIDGHEHIHFIPWIYKHLINTKKYDIIELRYPVESLNLIYFKNLFNLNFIRNFIAWILLKFFSLFNERKTNLQFYGMIFSNLYSKKILNIQKKINSKFKKEILLHTASTNVSEKSYFSAKYYKYFSSNNRNIEKQLLLKE